MEASQGAFFSLQACKLFVQVSLLARPPLSLPRKEPPPDDYANSRTIIIRPAKMWEFPSLHCAALETATRREQKCLHRGAMCVSVCFRLSLLPHVYVRERAVACLTAAHANWVPPYFTRCLQFSGEKSSGAGNSMATKLWRTIAIVKFWTARPALTDKIRVARNKIRFFFTARDKTKV